MNLKPMWLVLTVRRFRCRNPACLQRIFTKRLPEIAPVYSRRSSRLKEALLQIGLFGTAIPSLESSPEYILRWLYSGPEPTSPVNALKPTKTERNANIRELYATGNTLEQIACQYSISKARVWEIVRQCREP